MNDIKEALLGEMAAYFGADARRTRHARKVTEYAEEIWRREGGDYRIIIGAAVLHDIGIHQAETKYRSTAGRYQEIEGPPIARPILARLGFTPEEITEICDIIAHHHRPGAITSHNFGVLYDADWLVNLKDECDVRDTVKLERIIERVFLTESGKSLARAKYLP
ncbi:MAG: HD domain-containing protein [Chloroflexota bacterium]